MLEISAPGTGPINQTMRNLFHTNRNLVFASCFNFVSPREIFVRRGSICMEAGEVFAAEEDASAEAGAFSG